VWQKLNPPLRRLSSDTHSFPALLPRRSGAAHNHDTAQAETCFHCAVKDANIAGIAGITATKVGVIRGDWRRRCRPHNQAGAELAGMFNAPGTSSGRVAIQVSAPLMYRV
jgi:hypothetical protein